LNIATFDNFNVTYIMYSLSIGDLPFNIIAVNCC